MSSRSLTVPAALVAGLAVTLVLPQTGWVSPYLQLIISYVGINMSANPTYPLIVTGADMTHTVGLSEGGNTGPLMVGYTNAAPGPAGYYAVYAP